MTKPGLVLYKSKSPLNLDPIFVSLLLQCCTPSLNFISNYGAYLASNLFRDCMMELEQLRPCTAILTIKLPHKVVLLDLNLFHKASTFLLHTCNLVTDNSCHWKYIIDQVAVPHEIQSSSCYIAVPQCSCFMSNCFFFFQFVHFKMNGISYLTGNSGYLYFKSISGIFLYICTIYMRLHIKFLSVISIKYRNVNCSSILLKK